MRTARRHRYGAALVVAVASASVIAVLLPRVAAADTTLAGSAGFGTLPPTDSALTVSGHGIFKDLTVTVGQTKGLTNQAVSVTWTGAPPTYGAVGANVMQIFQCWSDPTVSDPRPENCQFGGFESTTGAYSTLGLGNKFSATRIVSVKGSTNYDPSAGALDKQGNAWVPFQAVDGTLIPVQKDLTTSTPSGESPWLNKYFDANTTNELPVAGTDGHGNGSTIFTVDTGLEAPGLGCGQQLLVHADSSKVTPKCWLVIVPRGSYAPPNPPGTPGATPDTPPLASDAWSNRIAVSLAFTPIGNSCSLGADERRIAGSELATSAVTNWQPTLCAAPGAPPYNYSSISDRLARQQLVSGQLGAPGMAVTSQPLDPATVDPANPVVYAPLTLSSLTVGFNILRTPSKKFASPDFTDPAEGPLLGSRVAEIRLTPRLVAKLLTESYQSLLGQVYNGEGGQPVPKGYEWIASNPADLVVDPDFLQFNPEFRNLLGNGAMAALVVEQPTSDAASRLWSWILADREAATWLAGTPDAWGMKVNPYYTTHAATNPSHQAFAQPVPDGYPASDPYCFQRTDQQSIMPIPNALPRPECVQDIQPYFNSMDAAAATTRAGQSGRREFFYEAPTTDSAFKTSAAQQYPSVEVMSVTDGASAARYGLQTAKLSAAGDDTSGRTFAAADPAGLLAGAKAMTPSDVPGVLKGNPSAPGAYPLTMLTYAAVTPRTLAAKVRPDYAAFITYAAGPGQVQGIGFGKLPPGYAPLPSSLVDQANAASALIRSGDPAPPDQPAGAAGPTTAAGHAATANSNANGTTGGNASSANPTASSALPSALPAVAKPSSKSSSAQRLLRTIGAAVGAIRYTLPAAVVIAVLAGAAAWILRRRRTPAAPSPVPAALDRPITPPAAPAPNGSTPVSSGDRPMSAGSRGDR